MDGVAAAQLHRRLFLWLLRKSGVLFAWSYSLLLCLYFCISLTASSRVPVVICTLYVACMFCVADACRGQAAPSVLVRARLRTVLHAEILERRPSAGQSFHPPHQRGHPEARGGLQRHVRSNR